MQTDIRQYHSLILDLDNTLYDERNYLVPAYAAMARWINTQFPNISEITAQAWLLDEYNHNRKNKLLSRWLEFLQLPESLLPDLLTILRNIQLPQKIRLFTQYYQPNCLLFHHPFNLFIITNGNPVQQRNKIRQIDFGNLNIKEIIYANEIEPKPGPGAIQYLIRHYQLDPSKVLSIGDQDTDKMASHAAGLDYLDITDFIKMITIQ